MMAILHRFRAFRRDCRGTSVLELGLAAPVLALLIVGISDLSRAISEHFTLQQAVNRGLEVVQATRPEARGTDSAVSYNHVIAEARTAAGTGATVTLRQWRECDGVSQTNYTDDCADGQETARYVELRINKNFVSDLYLGTRQMTARGALRIQ